MRVLLCVRGGAHEVPLVGAALRERGAEPIVWDTTAVPGRAAVSLAYDGAGFAFAIDGLGRSPGELDGIAAIWQAAVVGCELPAMAPGSRETCVMASERVVLGLLDSVPAFQLDPHARQQRADGKPLQLALARRLGLEIPETLITNDPEAVRAFAARVGPVIAKMLVQPAATGPETGGEAEVVFTTALDGDALADLEGLEMCPMIFQARLANARDIRVAIAGRRVIAGALEAGARGDDVDWRRDSHVHDRAPPWVPYELPGELAERLVRLVDRAGLEYAAIDLVAEPSGRHVFLELNATGAFAFLGGDLARPIAAAIADVLVDPAARRGVHGG